jgi:hypothetical protein
MFKRAFSLGLLLLATTMSTGCCGYWRGCGYRPCLFHRPWCNRCCNSSPTTDCCGSSQMGPTIDYSQPPIAPPGGMPKATPLTLR